MLPMAWPTPAAECRLTSAALPRGLRVAVGHADDDRFLQAEHVAEVVRKVAEERQLGRAGVAEDGRHPQLAQQARQRLRGR